MQLRLKLPQSEESLKSLSGQPRPPGAREAVRVRLPSIPAGGDKKTPDPAGQLLRPVPKQCFRPADPGWPQSSASARPAPARISAPAPPFAVPGSHDTRRPKAMPQTQLKRRGNSLSLRPACVLTYSRAPASPRPDTESRDSTSCTDADSAGSTSGGLGKGALQSAHARCYMQPLLPGALADT